MNRSNEYNVITVVTSGLNVKRGELLGLAEKRK
jgi:hypothetical protein